MHFASETNSLQYVLHIQRNIFLQLQKNILQVQTKIFQVQKKILQVHKTILQVAYGTLKAARGSEGICAWISKAEN